MEDKVSFAKSPGGLLLAVFCLLAAPASLRAACTCESAQALGSCAVKKVEYPDLYPGAVLVVPTQTRTYLYAADYFSGYTYRFDATQIDKPSATNPQIFPSPRGSNQTTGIACREIDVAGVKQVLLYWAIEGIIYRTGTALEDVTALGLVDLAGLAKVLRDATGDSTIGTGSLGGITYHAGRGTFWGVDIVNDVYFEFQENGQLLSGSGNPRYFFNPKRNKLAGGGYGDSLTYAVSGNREYFDIPVGSLTDRKASEVRRVHASDGVEPDTFKIGDDAGVFYPLGGTLGTIQFATGIAFWKDSCGADQHSEFLLDMDPAGAAPRIYQIAGDDPGAATIADFNCTNTNPNEVTLSWRKTLPYTNLKITRLNADVPGSTAVQVFENSDFAADPQQFVDTPVLDGNYDYTATVTAASAVPIVTCRVTLGPGSVVAHRKFKGHGLVSDPMPYAVTVVNGASVVVADLNTGGAEVFDVDLKPMLDPGSQKPITFAGPFDSGSITGLASKDGETAETSQLYWLQNDRGRHYLAVTNLRGTLQGDALTVRVPSNLQLNVQLGNIARDPVHDYLWTIDLVRGFVYPMTLEATIPAAFDAKQFPSPEANGFLSGGLAVVGATSKDVTLDVVVGKKAAGLAHQMARIQYDPANPSTAPQETGRLDIKDTVGSASLGGIAFFEGPSEKFQYVVAMDMRAIFKVRISAQPSTLVFFRRGDVNNDGALNISDPSYLLVHLFRQGAAPPCSQAADADDSNSLDITDAIYLFSYLFKGGPVPPPPFAACGVDSDSPLPCPEALCQN
jgi:hypothetical protein